MKTIITHVQITKTINIYIPVYQEMPEDKGRAIKRKYAKEYKISVKEIYLRTKEK